MVHCLLERYVLSEYHSAVVAAEHTSPLSLGVLCVKEPPSETALMRR